MTSLPKFFTSSPYPALAHFPHLSLATELQRPTFQPSHWPPGHMAQLASASV